MGRGNAGCLRCALGLSLVCATPVGTVPAATVETEREVDPTTSLPISLSYVSPQGPFGPVRCVLLRPSEKDRYGALPTFRSHKARQVTGVAGFCFEKGLGGFDETVQ